MSITAKERASAKEFKLSPHFTLWEAIRSRKYPKLVEMPNPLILDALKEHAIKIMEPIRLVMGRNKSLLVNSWYRNKRLNARVGGVKNSVHQIYFKDDDDDNQLYLGCATDIWSRHVSIFEMFKRSVVIPNEIPLKTIIIYPKRNFIHIDTRVTRKKRVWFVSMEKGHYEKVDSNTVYNIKDFLKGRFNFTEGE